MNKYQKALDELCSKAMVRVEDYDDENIGWHEYLDEEQLKFLKEPLQKLVDKATPKKPKDISITDEIRLAKCPNCNTKYEYELDYAGFRYCPRCGQAVDW